MRAVSWGGIALLAAVAAGCASGGPSRADRTLDTSEGPYGALSAEAAAGNFLDAARRNDFALMRRLFGSTDGPAEASLGRVEVEQRMFILASLLRHQSYSLRRMGVAMEEGKVQMLADMVGTRRGGVTVPIVTAQHEGRWFVEQVVTEPLTPR